MSDKTQDHTKTPWDGKEGQIYSEGDGKTIVYIPYYDEDNKRDRANAAFICQAVNSHEALVEA